MSKPSEPKNITNNKFQILCLFFHRTSAPEEVMEGADQQPKEGKNRMITGHRPTLYVYHK